MYDQVFSVHLVPGLRMKGIAHAKKLSAHLKENYGISSRVLGNETGAVYRLHLVMTYDSLAQLQQVSDSLLPGEFYGDWFAESRMDELYDWSSAKIHLYRAY